MIVVKGNERTFCGVSATFREKSDGRGKGTNFRGVQDGVE